MNADAVPEATRKMLGALWEKNIPIVRGRVDELREAAEAACAANLSPEARRGAEGTAHKLAGSLGMFGYQRGTVIAREMEQLLEGESPLDAQRLQALARDLQAELKL